MRIFGAFLARQNREPISHSFQGVFWAFSLLFLFPGCGIMGLQGGNGGSLSFEPAAAARELRLLEADLEDAARLLEGNGRSKRHERLCDVLRRVGCVAGEVGEVMEVHLQHPERDFSKASLLAVVELGLDLTEGLLEEAGSAEDREKWLPVVVLVRVVLRRVEAWAEGETDGS